jgi:prepilin-type N-terminal cleavage/methylation domain-containing protein/prepilin-type processing-associated H-X9-DG protein
MDARYKKTPRGFTLLEVLLVVTVIAILAAITLPSLAASRLTAKRAACATQLHGLGVAFNTYLSSPDVNYVMPVSAMLPSVNVGYEPIYVTLAREVTSPKVWRCPADGNGYTRTSDGQKFDSYFAGEGTSYEYSMSLGGKKVEKWFLYEMLRDTGTFVLADYDAFHDVKGADKAKNILFNDGHVGDIRDISNVLGAPKGPTP